MIDVFDIRDYGAIVNGIADDTNAIQLALNDIKSNSGGTLYFPKGITKINGTTQIDMTGFAGQIIFSGDGGSSSIHITSTGPDSVFYIANSPLVNVQNLTFVGTGNTGIDMTQSLFWFNVCEMSKVSNCRFIGLALTAPIDPTFSLNKWYGLLVGRQTNLVVEGSQFGGCSTANCPSIEVEDYYSLTIRDTQFVDWGAYQSGVRIKTGWQTNSYWIRALNADEPQDGFRRDKVILENITMDEGNNQTIYIDDVGSVELNSVHANAGNSPILSSIDIKNVNHVNITDSSVHQVNYAATNGVNLENCDEVVIENLKLEGIIDKLNITGTTKRVKIRNSDGVNIINTANAFIDADQIMQVTPSNNLVKPLGTVTHITGTTQLTNIDPTNFKVGDIITLIFDNYTPVVTTGNIKLYCGLNITATPGKRVTLIYDGTNFYE